MYLQFNEKGCILKSTKDIEIPKNAQVIFGISISFAYFNMKSFSLNWRYNSFLKLFRTLDTWCFLYVPLKISLSLMFSFLKACIYFLAIFQNITQSYNFGIALSLVPRKEDYFRLSFYSMAFTFHLQSEEIEITMAYMYLRSPFSRPWFNLRHAF